MARAIRVKGNDICYHVILRCNNGEFLLKEEEDFKKFLGLLGESQQKLSFKIYNYTLLHSHAHLILSTHEDHYIDEVMHHFCLGYSRDYNKRHGRTGHLWKNRYRCKPIITSHHALACLRYQHRNPDKGGLVSRPGEWPWCGYHFYAFGKFNDLLTPHPVYLGLAEDEEARRRIYKDFTERPLTQKEWNLFEKNNFSHSQRFQTAIRKTVLLHLPNFQGIHQVSGSL